MLGLPLGRLLLLKSETNFHIVNFIVSYLLESHTRHFKAVMSFILRFLYSASPFIYLDWLILFRKNK